MSFFLPSLSNVGRICLFKMWRSSNSLPYVAPHTLGMMSLELIFDEFTSHLHEIRPDFANLEWWDFLEAPINLLHDKFLQLKLTFILTSSRQIKGFLNCIHFLKLRCELLLYKPPFSSYDKHIDRATNAILFFFLFYKISQTQLRYKIPYLKSAKASNSTIPDNLLKIFSSLSIISSNKFNCQPSNTEQ